MVGPVNVGLFGEENVVVNHRGLKFLESLSRFVGICPEDLLVFENTGTLRIT